MKSPYTDADLQWAVKTLMLDHNTNADEAWDAVMLAVMQVLRYCKGKPTRTTLIQWANQQLAGLVRSRTKRGRMHFAPVEAADNLRSRPMYAMTTDDEMDEHIREGLPNAWEKIVAVARAEGLKVPA